MKALNREEVPHLPARKGGHLINLDGGYLGHHEPCEDEGQFKVRYRAVGHDVIKTFEKEK